MENTVGEISGPQKFIKNCRLTTMKI
jgi:hypothetical protein